MTPFKIAMVQHMSKKMDIENNTALAVAYIREAKQNGADFILFPECFITSYDMPEICDKLLPVEEIEHTEEFQKWCKMALTEEDAAIQAICDEAKECEIGVCITSFTKGVKYPRNTAFIINRQGEIILKYNKVHTCDFGTERYIESGTAFHVCTFDNIKIGVMICYDREYPESARELMLQGAEMILVPNCCSDMKMRLKELSVRAMENMCVVAMANPPGERMGNTCAFHPMVWDYDDNLIIAAKESFDGLVYAEVDMEQVRAYCAQEDLGKFRKVQAYKHLV